MEILVCVKRVPSPGAKIALTADGTRVDTTHLAFTMSPHEECAVEEAVRLATAHGGSSTVLTLGSAAADEQVRHAISMGVDHGVLIDAGDEQVDPQATARAIGAAVRDLERGREPFDLILFGNESADAANYQVGIRVAHALGRPTVGGIKAIEPHDGVVALTRGTADGSEHYELPLPAVVGVKEGINVPRYPALKGRVRAKKAAVASVAATPDPGGLATVGLRHPPQQAADTRVLGHGAEAVPAIADLLERLGVNT
ncbi:electron transfer flavoprotein beta subunit/FixA family protein [Egibacter rhizosphaerae]|uniref:Electron transfer flavoprotein beta subunit/FixA family protein n=1 Tax=Egibacter rhizosphaerae TaxID=1670831 RepID=A0A411YDE6_9ACTN|nr:electron transfer flavoprotein subunit beta/FixA family protein [Egibacter rhizosphaerae]QBI19244.1 electron transfer flavoprotein beta subunit/FixA family protein [Egibacter rhizosphaerae]